jgi:hypothetical protein
LKGYVKNRISKPNHVGKYPETFPDGLKFEKMTFTTYVLTG